MDSSSSRTKKSLRLGAGVAVLVGLTTVGAPSSSADSSFDPSAAQARIAGADRYATAAAIALSTWDAADTVVVANGESNGIDAISASYLAGAVNAPILLTQAGTVPAATAEALAALDPSEVVVVGGESSVSASTYATLTAGRSGDRIAGTDRFDTAARIAQAAADASSAPATSVFIARGDVYGNQVAADALAVSPVAYRAGVPVLLTGADGLSASTAAALSALQPTSVVVLGGENSVSAAIAGQAAAAAGVDSTTRLQGADRTETAAAIAESGIAADAGFLDTGVGLANGYRIDALAAGPAAGEAGFPLLLTGSATTLGAGTERYLQENAATLTTAQVYGGTASVANSATRAAAVAGGNDDPAGASDVVTLAEAFAAALTDDQKTALYQEYTFANASNWSNLPNDLLGGGGGGGGTPPTGGTAPTGAPTGGTPPTGAPTSGATATATATGTATEAPTGTATGTAPGGGGTSSGRVGLQTDSLTDEQWTALETLLAAATGSGENEGYDEIVQHLAADDYLADNGGGDSYGRGNFFVAFLGTPADTGTWELQFGGHHLAVANTYTDGALAGATPSFRGIEPMTTVTLDGVTVDAEQQERAAFAAVLASLDETQKNTARLSQSFNDIVLGPGSDWAFPETASGVKGSDLDDTQRALVLAAIGKYVGDIADADAATVLAGYESELDDTYVSYAGTGNMTDIGDYVRIDGPSVWIEFSLQNGVVLEGAHPHAVWRDKTTDYGGQTS
ncbi:DUF3500 domain-containing protein [Kineococcus sp. SYSU DK003]|uniref:DUF3500 domain-containing protein n=1 Tax=Kineococcus sp. SYSU DK003 TaxID=3383124 RepID=UPI003D7E68C0